MKKSILILLSISTISIAFTQGNNLQFNRVVNESGSSTTTVSDSHISSGSINVPNNKVLKITSGSVYTYYNGTNTDYECGLKIDDHILIRRSTNNQGSDYNYNGIYPIWLGSGNHVVYVEKGASGSRDITWSISGVEFNIVQ